MTSSTKGLILPLVAALLLSGCLGATGQEPGHQTPFTLQGPEQGQHVQEERAEGAHRQVSTTVTHTLTGVGNLDPGFFAVVHGCAIHDFAIPEDTQWLQVTLSSDPENGGWIDLALQNPNHQRKASSNQQGDVTIDVENPEGPWTVYTIPRGATVTQTYDLTVTYHGPVTDLEVDSRNAPDDPCEDAGQH